MKPPKKVFVIGLDGATFRSLEPLLNAGKLPFLASQLKTGYSSILQSTLPAVSAPAWASFQTGVNPGKHGVYNFFHRRSQEDISIVDSNSIKAEKIWQILNRHQKKCLIINMPLSYPLKPIDGIITSSFMTPSGAKYFYPDSIEKTLKKFSYRVDYQSRETMGQPPDPKNKDRKKQAILNEVKEMCRNRIKTFSYLASKDSFDFYFLYFKSSDFIQHVFFNTSYLEEYWVHLDKLLGKAHKKLTQSVSVPLYTFIISDHGFHPAAQYQFSPYSWFNSLNLSQSPSLKNSKKNSWHQLHRAHHLIKKTGINLSNLPLISSYRQNLVTDTISDSKKHYQQVGYQPSIEGLYLSSNLRNQTTISKLNQASKKVKHKSNYIFQFSSPADKVFHGPYAHLGPDLVWIPNESYSLNHSPLTSELIIPRTTHILGEHFADTQGIIIVNGPDIKHSDYRTYPAKISPNHNDSSDLFQSIYQAYPNIRDLLPTILQLYQINPSSNIDGKVIKSIFHKSSNLNPKHAPKTTSKKLTDQVTI